MTKAEQRALDAYPPEMEYCPTKDNNEFAREVYIEAYKQAIEDAAHWWATKPDDTYFFNPCAGFVNRFKKEMNE